MAIVKILVYLASGIITLPGALLAYFVWTVKGMSDSKNIFDALFFLLVNAVRLLEWGILLILASLMIWLTLAFVPKYRFIGALGMSLVALATLTEFFIVWWPPRSPGDLFLPFISLTGLFLNLWLASEVFAKPS